MFRLQMLLVMLLFIVSHGGTAFGYDGEIYISDKDLSTEFDCADFDVSKLLSGKISHSDISHSKHSGEHVCQIWTKTAEPYNAPFLISIKVWEWKEGWHEPRDYGEYLDMVEINREGEILEGFIDEFSWLEHEGWSYGERRTSSDKIDLYAGPFAELTLVAGNGTLECSIKGARDQTFDEQEFLDFCDSVQELILAP